MKNSLRNTRLLVIASLIGSFLSFFTIAGGYGEVYPFYYWKLYSQPAGWEGHATTNRVYINNENGFTRLALENMGSFTRDDFNYTLNFILDEDNSIEEKEKKLKIFCEHIYPGHDEYYIVKETYNPQTVFKQPDSYEKTILFRVK